MSLSKLKELIQSHEIKIVEFSFTDVLGLWQHFSITTDEVNKGLFDDGMGFDGSSMIGRLVDI